MGEFNNGKKVGTWKILFKEYGTYNQIGGGSYDQEGQELKIGEWIVLGDRFEKEKQVTFVGEYNYGKKVGRWDIWFKQYRYGSDGKNNKIGGGSYDNAGNEVKIGMWKELDDKFGFQKEISYIGEYKNGKKVGGWEITLLDEVIGGGEYDEDGNNNKIGQWIEIFTYNGEYDNCKKIGRWNIMFKENEKDKQNNKIGGGSYDNGGNGIKIGLWIEIDDKFSLQRQLTYIGEYQNGKKVGFWDMYFKEYGNDKQNNKIGGGSYDDEGNGIKGGEWIDIAFHFDQSHQITYKGQYLNGQKIGLWKTCRRENNILKLQCCVNYNQNGKEIFRSREDSNFIDMGEFNNGKKVGTWKILFKENDTYNQIGGGSYDQEGQELKIGEWIVLGDRYEIEKQVTFVGEYNYGKKVGRWDIWFKQYRYGSDGKNNKIGGGSYDNAGNEVKIGMWKELDDKFGFQKEISYIGEYKNGKKVGGWEITLLDEVIGGGAYDEDGNNNKIGQWIEQDFAFNNHQLLLYKGEYKNGQKVGRWDVFFREQNEKSLKNIGYGSFDKGGNGIKIVKWYFLENEIRTRNVISYNQSWMKLAVEKQKEF